MAALLFIIVLIVGVAAVAFGVSVGLTIVGNLDRAGSNNKAALRAEREQNRIATKTLRQIANGTTGNPVLEAQIALDDIEKKEIES